MTLRPNSYKKLPDEEYKYGFYTDIEAESLPPGLTEEVSWPHLGEETRTRMDDGSGDLTPTGSGTK